MAEKETIVTKMYDLVKYLIPVVNRFPCDYKFTLGDRITQLILDLLEHYVAAYYTTNRQAKINLLVEVNLAQYGPFGLPLLIVAENLSS
ncbi:MAG: four helix bundle protein [candidate division KSB1 bacterium]|nr:four helix bundle protein [candidate division KSB1 bacterium]